MHRIETSIAGIAIPDSALCREATEFVPGGVHAAAVPPFTA